MDFFAVNWLAVIVATVASMIFGMGWYMGLSKQWLAAIGKTREEISGSSAAPFVVAAICQLVLAYFLAMITAAVYAPAAGAAVDLQLADAITMGVVLWAGFIVTTMTINHRYQNAKWSLTIIDAGHFLGVVMVQGTVLGLLG
ncbi:MAG: DUF1761 domain-containing protein [Alphaproteobacteria bacterium]|nr:DUF1761 domain-containing protein [Alphaproteobacteria bacterium]